MSSGSPVEPHRDGTTIDLYVQPRAARSEIIGLHDAALRLRITAPPVDGAANAEVIAFLAKELGVSKTRVELISGHRGRRKRFLVHGMQAEDVRAKLLDPLARITAAS